MLTVSEMAERLGVSDRRVRQLIAAGQLDARKVAGVWLVEPPATDPRRPHGAAGHRRFHGSGIPIDETETEKADRALRGHRKR